MPRWSPKCTTLFADIHSFANLSRRTPPYRRSLCRRSLSLSSAPTRRLSEAHSPASLRTRPAQRSPRLPFSSTTTRPATNAAWSQDPTDASPLHPFPSGPTPSPCSMLASRNSAARDIPLDHRPEQADRPRTHRRFRAAAGHRRRHALCRQSLHPADLGPCRRAPDQAASAERPKL